MAIHSLPPFLKSSSNLLGSLRMLLLVATLKYLFVGWRWVVAVGWRRGVGTHHHMGGARLCRVSRVCHCNPWLAYRHPIDPKALHAPWLLGDCKYKRERSNYHLVSNDLLLNMNILYIHYSPVYYLLGYNGPVEEEEAKMTLL